MAKSRGKTQIKVKEGRKTGQALLAQRGDGYLDRPRRSSGYGFLGRARKEGQNPEDLVVVSTGGLGKE